jgi:hypothetical protein
VEPALSSIIIVLIQIAVVLAAGIVYLRRVRVDRPPVGVFNGRDILIVGTVLVAVPVVYLRLPTPVLAGVFAVLSASILYFSLSPLLGSRPAAWTGLALVALDIAIAQLLRQSSPEVFHVVNNLALAVAVIGVANLWVQSGIRASHVALLGLGLAVYDAIATLAMPLMTQFVDRVATLPLAPMFVWGAGEGQVGIGLGDLLVMLVWTLVAEKAFSARAGLVAAGLSLACVFGLFTAFWLDMVNRPLPAMVIMGPVIAGHYVSLKRQAKQERTFAAYESDVRNRGHRTQLVSVATAAPASNRT